MGKLQRPIAVLVCLVGAGLCSCGFRTPLDDLASGTDGDSAHKGGTIEGSNNGGSGGNGGIAGTLPGGVDTVVAGLSFSCANLRQGLYCWGEVPGFYAATQDAWRARQLETIRPDFVAAGGSTLCVSESGRVRCWAAPGEAALPSDTSCTGNSCSSDGYNVIPALAGATQIDLSSSHGCAVMADTTVLCWGANDQGQLGHAPGTGGDGDCPETAISKCNSQPSPVQGLSGAVEVAVGASIDGPRGFSCARLTDGAVMCWGDNSKGQATTPAARGGPGSDRSAHASPSRVILSGAAGRITANGQFACAVVGGQVTCWGDENLDLWSSPEFVEMLSGGDKGSASPVNEVTDLSSGNLHLCMIQRGSVLCFGTNMLSQLGRGDVVTFDTPCTVGGQPTYCSAAANPVANLTGAISVGAGTNHTCVLLTDRSVRCWGSNSSQQLGFELKSFGDLSPRATPVKVQGLP